MTASRRAHALTCANCSGGLLGERLTRKSTNALPTGRRNASLSRTVVDAVSFEGRAPLELMGRVNSIRRSLCSAFARACAARKSTSHFGAGGTAAFDGAADSAGARGLFKELSAKAPKTQVAKNSTGRRIAARCRMRNSLSLQLATPNGAVQHGLTDARGCHSQMQTRCRQANNEHATNGNACQIKALRGPLAQRLWAASVGFAGIVALIVGTNRRRWARRTRS